MDRRTCPKCHSGMRHEEPSTWTCLGLGCGGLWIERDGYADALAGVGGTDALLVELGRESADTAHDCPSCGSVKLEASMARGVELDWCRLCGGIHFDRGELERLKPRQHARAEPESTPAVPAAGLASDVVTDVVGDVALVVLRLIGEVISD